MTELNQKAATNWTATTHWLCVVRATQLVWDAVRDEHD